MIKQYIAFGALILIAALIFSNVDWGSAGSASNLQGDIENQFDIPTRAKPVEDNIIESDIRSGGKLRRRSVGASPDRSRNQLSATSTDFRAATSTGFRARSNGLNPFTHNQGSSSIEYIQLPRVSSPKIASVGNKSSQALVSIPSNQPASTKRSSDKTLQDEQAESGPEQTSEDEANIAKEKDEISEISSNVQLSGHVVDTTGKAIQNLVLDLKLLQALPEQQAIFNDRVLSVQTDEHGRYIFRNLVEGDFQICTREEAGIVRACQRKRAPHSAADFSLQKTSNASIFGVVKDNSGTPLQGVQVSVTPRHPNRVITNDSGEYQLAMSVNGGTRYGVYFTKQDFQRKGVQLKGEELLSKRRQRIDAVMSGIDRKGFDVSGFVQDDAGSFLQGRVIRLYSPSLKLNYQLKSTSRRDGRFKIQNVQAANDYRLSVNTNGGYLFDASPYQNMKVYEGMPPLNLQLKNTGKGTLTASIFKGNHIPLAGVNFRLNSSGTLIRGTTDAQGSVTFSNVPATTKKKEINISNTSSPNYSFSGISLAAGEHKNLTALQVDAGQYELTVTVQDETGLALSGAQGNLSWSRVFDGVTSKTVRSRGKVSQASGTINYSKLSSGSHSLRVSKSGYETYSEVININQLFQNLPIRLVKK